MSHEAKPHYEKETVAHRNHFVVVWGVCGSAVLSLSRSSFLPPPIRAPAQPRSERRSELLPSADPSANGPGDPQPQRSSGPTNNGTSAPSKPSDQPSVRHRGPSSSASASASYTEEQIAIVRQIKKKKDYYEILGVEKSCTVEDVRKAYRKLSLKVHPDKNKAPDAEEAFKAVSKAFQCLSNEEEIFRRYYYLNKFLLLF
ncbi:hypothetical protein SO802_024377 [Lithocarpus litseifolius]|uniref:J domain-containing protein n=1 Tax=Lithocarpus litseifolius TaxID=425828 RepID=A0AAW2C8X2_9ROSI